MLREVANAVFVTFLGSEWLYADDGAGPSSLLRRPAARRAAAGAAAVNVFCALAPGAGDLRAFAAAAGTRSGAATLEAAVASAVVCGLAARRGRTVVPAAAALLFAACWAVCYAFAGASARHAPRAFVAAAAYVAALYADCRRSPRLDAGVFARELARAALLVAPVYPLLAVAISLVFLVLISAFERLGLPLELLDAPLYYGVLYGPLAAVYVEAKRGILGRRDALPTTRPGDAAVARCRAAQRRFDAL